ncbi:MAG: phosphodiester glycosidase family protein, partial [Clostridia bacterium]|nr:phosphodiester glycosidase family protein [Clostridia bacterium]
GMIEPWHYVILTAKGRSDDSKGIYLDWLADRMLYLGATEAMNLDGGGTVSLIFNGKMLNKTTKNLRSVTSIITFGQIDQ